MLSIGLIGMNQQRYYTDLSREDYYTEGGEPEGEWFGTGASQLGLEGTVDKDALSKLFRGFTPDGERKLVRNADSEKRRAAFDLTFNAPKSVSVLFSQASAEHRRVVQEAQAAAVRAALEYIQRAAGQIRLGKDGTESIAAGLTVATFEHSSARLVPGEAVPDPHLHTHAVVINTGLTEDGRSATLDSREILRHKMSAGVLYRAELLRQIERRLGLTTTRTGKFHELRAVPSELIEEFSKRRRAIERELEDRGITEYGKHTTDAALKTRTSKPTVDRARFIEEWQRIGREHGLVLDDAFFESNLGRAPERDVFELISDATHRAAMRVTAQQSHFAEREYVRALAEELEDKGVGAEGILAGAKAYLETADIVKVGESNGEQRFTTREMLELEKRMLGSAEERTPRSHRVRTGHVETVLSLRPTITREQREALLQVTQGRGLSIVRGVAGSGKTYMLQAAREAWEAEGCKVLGAALAATAAKRLEDDSGIESTSIHKLLYEVRKDRQKLTGRTVLVIDEAAMVGTRQMQELVSLAHEHEAKLVLVGDDRQLQAIDAGAPFAGMRQRFGAAEMEEIRRQKDEWARDAVHEFSRGDAKAALKRFAERGLIHVLESKADVVRRLTADFLEAAKESGLAETLVLTGTRAEARKVNREIQLRRRLAGELREERIELHGEVFHPGDRVLFKKNSTRVGVLNGDRGEVVELSEHGMTVRLDDGRRVTIHADSGELVAPHLGYASTTHSAQGATVDRALVLAGGVMQDREATYVQASRARVESRIYVDAVTAGDTELQELAQSMERSRAKDLATDVLEQQGGQGQELEAA